MRERTCKQRLQTDVTAHLAESGHKMGDGAGGTLVEAVQRHDGFPAHELLGVVQQLRNLRRTLTFNHACTLTVTVNPSKSQQSFGTSECLEVHCHFTLPRALPGSEQLG